MPTSKELHKPWRTAIKNTKSIGGSIIANAYGSTAEESKANARLIAAAPELLEALQALFEEVRAMIVPATCYDSISDETEKKAIAAIKKATE